MDSPARLPPNRILLFALFVAVAFACCLGPLPAARASDQRLVLAFYYAWYDHNTWTSGTLSDLPATPYASADREATARHIQQAQASGIDALILNWWGQGNQTEANLRALLDLAAERGFHIAVDFDINSPFMGGEAAYAENLRHLHAGHATHPAYLRSTGRPVVFFYNVSRLPLATWQRLRNQVDPGRDALWIAEGTDLAYQAVFDGHHLYSITWPNRVPPSQTLPKWGNRLRAYNQKHGTAKLWVATVMPGYDDRRIRPETGFVRARDGGDYYRGCWQAAIDSRPQWIVINSFNEWPEGTYIEPSQSHGSLYLDLTREWSARFRDAAFSQSAAPASSPTPTPPMPTEVPPAQTLIEITPMPDPPPALISGEEWASLRPRLIQGCGLLLANPPVVAWTLVCPDVTPQPQTLTLIH
jgi:hypothetical protein